MKKNTYTIPLALVFCLFFLWAISSNLLPTMIRQLMKTCELNTFEASFTETAYWLAYFIFPIPIAMFMKRYSYKSRRRALLLCAVGLIGVGGLHRIYCGKILSGVIYFCTGGLLLAGTIADLLLILNRSFCDAGGRPLI